MIEAIIIALLANAATLAGENIWSSEGPYGASVKTIAINPIDSNCMLIGTIEDGIYETTDAGESWRHINPAVMPTTLRGIEYNIAAPDTVYACAVGGVFKSTDAGESWTDITPPGRTGQEFRTIEVVPDRPNIIITGGQFDRWKSTDSGQNWQEFAVDPPWPGGPDHEIDGLTIDPTNTNIAYLVTPDAEFGAGIYKSIDQGDTWFNIQNNSDSSGFGMDVAIDPTNTDIIYYARDDYARVSGRFLSKSTDAGASWFDISPSNLTRWGVFAVRVDPTDHNNVYIATAVDGVYKSTDGGDTWSQKSDSIKALRAATLEIDFQNRAIFLGVFRDGIYKSVNGAETWRRISQNIIGLDCGKITFLANQFHSSLVAAVQDYFRRDEDAGPWSYIETGIQGGIRAILADDSLSNYVYVCSTPLGFYISSDSGFTWELRNSGLPIASYWGLAISYSEEGARRIFLATSGLFRSDDWGQSWQRCQGGLPEQYYYKVFVSPINPNIIGAVDFNNRIYISINRGENWFETTPLPRYDDAWIENLQFDPVDTYCVYASDPSYGLYKSTDLGLNWININNNLPLYPGYPLVFGPAINPQNNQNMFVASNQRGIYQTIDGGLHWEPFNIGLDTNFAGGHVYFVPGDTTRLYYATYGHSVWSIHRTLDNIDDDPNVLPDKVTLSNYPNPFNSSTKISFVLPKEEHISLNLYDITGRKVAVVDEGTYPAGSHSLNLSLKDHASGIYYLMLNTEGTQITRKLIMIK
jgi:photosystem II stability/assembly factor-like uncharacterized protein